MLWKLKLRHFACMGAFIVVMAHGFETFSQQMVTFEQRPRRVANVGTSPAPAPPRSEVWDTYVSRGYLGGGLDETEGPMGNVCLLTLRARLCSGFLDQGCHL